MNPLETGKTYHFPGKDMAYKLGENPGREEIHVIGALTPLPSLEGIQPRPERSGEPG